MPAAHLASRPEPRLRNLFAVVAAANGEDTTLTLTPTETNTSVNTAAYQVLNHAGWPTAHPTPLGSAIIGRVKDATTLHLPAGAVDDAGFAANDIVLVSIPPAGATTAFLVASTDSGHNLAAHR